MKLLSFRIWGELFGLNIASVKEINRNVHCTEAPTAPPQIIGLYNMRGQIVTVFDLALLLGYEPIKRNKLYNCILLKNNDHSDRIGFAVEKAEDVLSIDELMIKNPPANVDEKVKEKLLGLFELENDILLIIDEKKLYDQLYSVS